MSGKRCKALKLAFWKMHGRAPRKAEWRRVERKAKHLKKIVEWLQGVVFVKSEWRQRKKGWRQFRLAKARGC